MRNEDNKKGRLRGPANFTGTKALRADLEPSRLSAAYVYLDALDVDEPASSRVTIGMADSVACTGASAAAITKLGHPVFPPRKAHKSLRNSARAL